MASSLRVLIIEDSDSDAELIIRLLKKSGFAPIFKQVQTSEEMNDALEKEWDIILSDYSMPQFDAPAALQILKTTGRDIPFIVVSGAIGEETAVSIMKAGAHDYLMKDNLSRLIPAIQRELREAEIRKDKIQLEIQLRQAQKMEAVGQLAGGVAHDFNNLLQVIIGYTEMILDEAIPKSNFIKYANSIKKASRRATDLIRQLLLFSRKQAMQPKLINLNELIGNVMTMISRMIGENITLECHPGSNLYSILADPGQIEQILINMCLNSRDAMPDGGCIRIITENISLFSDYCQEHPWAKPGNYVLMTVYDNGCGIPREIQDHVFEPFFTTKEVGKGTGLGLAAVYGIVKSHAGLIHLYSEEGYGTLFKIYLPSAENKTISEDNEETKTKPRSGLGEMILIAEDEEEVRKLTVSILENAGYRIISAQDGEEAIKLFEKYQKEIKLALLDVVMPKLSGQKVFERIKTIKPDIPVLFLTGYSKDVLPKSIAPDSQYEIIQKPIYRSALLCKISEILANE
ncbi:MAG: response regulator [Desulfobacterales bacterium]|nr:response regulator [Desulfobacterales bacterium]